MDKFQEIDNEIKRKQTELEEKEKRIGRKGMRHNSVVFDDHDKTIARQDTMQILMSSENRNVKNDEQKEQSMKDKLKEIRNKKRNKEESDMLAEVSSSYSS